MSGPIHGEVLDITRRLRQLGLSRNAVDALTVIAEGCRRETRIGACPRARIADKLFGVERTASRAVSELVAAGLVQVVVAGGGRGRTAVATTYRIVDLQQWLWLHDPRDTRHDPRDTPDPQDIQVSPGSEEPGGSAGHPGVPPKCPADPGDTDRRDISSPSAGHPDVSPPVPVEDLVETSEVTTGPREERPPAEPAAPSRADAARIRARAHTAYGPPAPAPRCLPHADLPADTYPPGCPDCARLARAQRARHTDLARGEARARRACRACNRFGLVLGPAGQLLDQRCAHPHVPDWIWTGTDPPAPAPPNTGRHHRPDPQTAYPGRPPGWRPSPNPRPRTPEGALLDA